MNASWFQKLTLGIAGIAALGIGIAITAAPVAFYGTYGIALGDDPSLLSELRAPGANLAALGMIILAGAVYQRMQRLAAFLGVTVFLAYASGRIVSMALDGMPASGLVQATLIELVVGGLCAAVLWRGKSRRASSDPLLGLSG
ncbi:MAG: DUF4345 domain-containing protein [Pseudomonadota bacterium]